MITSSAQPVPESPVVFKRKAGWEGIRLEHCGLKSGELPEHCHREHVVLVSLSDGYRGEMTTASGAHIRGPQSKGSVCVLPAGMAHKARLQGDSEYLALYLDPAVVQRAATESRLSGNVELIEKYTTSDKVISTVAMALLAELESEGLSGRLYGESLLTCWRFICSGTIQVRPVLSRANGGLSGQRLRQVKDFIAANYASDPRLEDLAHEAGMSSFHCA